MMNGGLLPTNPLHEGALDLASLAPQLMSCNYYRMYSDTRTQTCTAHTHTHTQTDTFLPSFDLVNGMVKFHLFGWVCN